VELYERIRLARANQRWGIRRLAKEFGTHRREVRRALASAIPPSPSIVNRPRPALGRWTSFIDGILVTDREESRKQRHTARRIWTRLVKEKGAEVAEITVRRYVRERKRELYGLPEVMVPQLRMPGQEAEVDLYEADIDFHELGRQRVVFFQMRACYSGASFHWPLRNETQQAFFEAHCAAFEYFNGVFKTIRYDNLGLAVRKVLRGRTRLENNRFVILRSHYLFEAEFCLVGEQGAHEKGGVEGEVGYFRRNYMVPVPKVGGWGHLIDHCQFGSRDELDRHLDGRPDSVGQRWEQERGHLRPLPDERCDTDLQFLARVDIKSRASVLRNRYSVPVRLAGLQVEVRVNTLSVSFRHRGREVACHERLYGSGGDSLILDHYLEVLRYKPRALAGSLALHQAQTNGSFPLSYRELLRRLRDRLGESEGARQMVDVLFLHRRYGPEVMFTAVDRALESGAYDYHAVALMAAGIDAPKPVAQPLRLHLVTDPEVPIPDTRQYDRLLNGGA